MKCIKDKRLDKCGSMGVPFERSFGGLVDSMLIYKSTGISYIARQSVTHVPSSSSLTLGFLHQWIPGETKER